MANDRCRVAGKPSAPYMNRSLRRELPAPYREGEGGRGGDPSKPRSPARPGHDVTFVCYGDSGTRLGGGKL